VNGDHLRAAFAQYTTVVATCKAIFTCGAGNTHIGNSSSNTGASGENSGDAGVQPSYGSPPSTPRWVKGFGILVILLILLLLLVHLNDNGSLRVGVTVTGQEASLSGIMRLNRN
jgi:hypothetical protein